MFQYCPKCASQNIKFEEGKVFRCPDCDFLYYHNTAAATGCIIVVPDSAASSAASITGKRLLFLVRGKEPGKGKLDIPGGFVDPGESALEGLYRELKEEIGWTPPVPDGMPLEKVFTLFASFPNVYPYKNISYNTCDLYFYIHAPELHEQDLRLAKDEINSARLLAPNEINYDDFAFDSTRKAVRLFCQLASG
jgi:8-oxo-dGTP pyrophosphatase MutT (NUDIX family)